MNNTQIRERLRINSLIDKIEYGKIRWYDHVKRIDTGRLPRQTIEYRLKGKLPLGRPRYKLERQIKNGIKSRGIN